MDSIIILLISNIAKHTVLQLCFLTSVNFCKLKTLYFLLLLQVSNLVTSLLDTFFFFFKPLSCVQLSMTPWTTVCEILQARILEWVAFPFSKGSSQSRDWTQVSHILYFTNKWMNTSL